MGLSYSLIIICLANALLWRLVAPDQLEKKLEAKAVSKSCSEPKFLGLCRGKLLRYAYDNKTRSCVSFYYSGCGGNRNNFLTYEECRRECVTQTRY